MSQPQPTAKPNRELTFWLLHLLGWAGYAFSHYLGALVYDKPAGYYKVIVTAALAGFVVSAPLRYVCRVLWSKPPSLMIPAALFAAYAAAVIWRLIVNVAYETFMAGEHPPMTTVLEYMAGSVGAMYLMSSWVVLYFGFRYYESTQLQREAALRAATLAQEAQLKMLRYQLNPHFLFNTLNAISTLILDNRNQVANSAVTGLSEFLRYTLDQDPMKKVTVAQELDAINLYLDIEKMRFGDRLRLEFNIDRDAMTALMPSLLLQPLIENAIKYAVSPREEGGTISISGQVRAFKLHLTVRDDGPGLIDPTRIANGRGVGIRNTRERLQVLYGEGGRVDVSAAQPGLKVELVFPMELASAPL